MMIKTIITEPEKCVGCRRCQLACSFHNTGIFNIHDANIRIVENNTDIEEIIFTDNCKKCWTCVSYCAYGALKIRGV
jgi:carbon-monoxide dehydrogenase iron sulfur subunit